MGPELIDSTGDHRCDAITQGLIGIIDIAFPDRLRGVYLRGSRVGGTAVEGSDLDLFAIFKGQFADRAEFDRARRLVDHCARLSPVLLEVIVLGEQVLTHPQAISTALNLKLATRLLYGGDLRPGLPDFDAAGYLRSVIHTPLNSYLFPDQRTEPLPFPLCHIEPDGPLFGFDRWPTPDVEGIERPSTKLLVATVGWTATAIIALRTGRYVRDKGDCVAQYRQYVGDEWAELVTRTHDLCRNHWHYRIPTDDHDRRTLRELCDRTLQFQNHFLALYRDFQRAELGSGDPDRQRLAEQRLAQIAYPPS
ncbi:nucleotidyltransferase domain-containing protein [Microlunatus speluncae]|uniref:nucleotidyltransferase domain-containing protein n=1 Tax=Microlunatus speluncae TaxID=2594267 RepID=UPI0012665330|nr:nucleotidyltransferase domain-containing protein [Microlunatus speluncae]